MRIINKTIVTIFILIAVFSSYQVEAQTAKDFIESLPEIQIPNLYGESNSYMVGLKESTHASIPDSLFNVWKDATVKYVNENGVERNSETYFPGIETTRAIGRINMRNDYYVVLYCVFTVSQTWGELASFDMNGNILSTQTCYIEDVEGTGFFTTSIQNELIVLESGENAASEDIIKVNDQGYFETKSYTIYEDGYDFLTPR